MQGLNAKRQVFYSFHYKPDCWRAAQVRSIGVIEGNRPAPDNDWEEIKGAGEDAIRRWINKQLEYRSCTLVLVGSETANRKWINYEIVESWNRGMGVAGIYIHGLMDNNKFVSHIGNNPFDYILLGGNIPLSSVAKCYNPIGANSKEIYDWISRNISAMVEEAITIRSKY